MFTPAMQIGAAIMAMGSALIISKAVFGHQPPTKRLPSGEWRPSATHTWQMLTGAGVMIAGGIFGCL